MRASVGFPKRRPRPRANRLSKAAVLTPSYEVGGGAQAMLSYNSAVAILMSRSAAIPMGTFPDRLPLVIGVTGHRDPRSQDIPLLEREIDAAIVRLRSDYLGDDTETPIILLSSLAEGADQLVAHAALARGAQLIATLPLPLEEYRRDFAPGLTPGAVLPFDKLLSQSSRTLIMPFTEGNSLDAIRTDKDKRDEQYRAVGLFIIQNCDVLIALWDGNENDEAVGGTTEVVTFKRHGVPLTVPRSARVSLDGPEIGPVIHVVTPRKKLGSSASTVSVRAWGRDIIKLHRGDTIRRLIQRAAVSVAYLLGREPKDVTSGLPPKSRIELEAWETFGNLVELTREFNNEAAALTTTDKGQRRTAQSLDDLFTDSEGLDKIAKQRVLSMASRECNLYAIADTLAQERQAQFKRDWIGLLVLGFIAFLLFAFYHVSSGNDGYSFSFFNIVFLSGYILFVVITFIVYRWARSQRHQERFLDYRALAEALRVAIFWNVLGIGRHRTDRKVMVGKNFAANANTQEVASCYPIKQPSELAWVKNCLSRLEQLIGSRDANTEHELDQETHSIAWRYWVRGQLSYFTRQGLWHNGRGQQLESLASIFFAVQIVVVVVLLPLFGLCDKCQFLGLTLRDIFLVTITVLPGLAAVFASYSDRLALDAQARQYDRMRALFERAYILLPEEVDGSSVNPVLALYRELGSEAMKENAEWVAIYRQRPIRPQ
jgi:hypothetical protein